MATVPNLAGLDAGLPANVDAEKTVLGAILLDNEAFFDDTSELTVEDFSLDSHRKIYLLMNDILFGMIEGVRAVDIVTLANELKKRHWVEQIGGIAYLAGLTEGLPRRPVIREYIRILQDKTKLRRVMGICAAGVARAADQSEPAMDIIGSLQNQIADVIGEGTSGAVSIGSVTAAVEAAVNKARVISTERTSLEMTWGLEELDQQTKGCFRGEFTVLSGESSGFKTAFAIQTTIANAREGTPVVWQSLEMTKEALAKRFYASMSTTLTATHMRDPRTMNLHTHVPAMQEVSRELAKLPIDIDDSSPLRIDKLKARIRAMRRKWKKDGRAATDRMLVVIDYLQLIKGMPRMSPQEAFAYTIYTLRDLPKDEPEVHILCLSQYSQGDKFGKNKSRTKDSLYGGAIIHHAAQNVFMIRVEDPDDKHPGDLLDAEIKIEKQREGKRTTVKTYADRDHLRLGNPQQPLR